MDFEHTGAQRFAAALNSAEVKRIADLFRDDHSPGRRLSLADLGSVAALLRRTGVVGRIASRLIGSAAQPVRALLLDKSPEKNWRLGWHQDRVIAVRERLDVEGFTNWSVKAGQMHVQPPHELLARMATFRIHVDSVGTCNAPLQVLAGSHSLGQLTEDRIGTLASAFDVITCLASAGDVWAYRTAVVHASAEQRTPGRRRVLQVDYSADDLPDGLKWQSLI